MNWKLMLTSLVGGDDILYCGAGNDLLQGLKGNDLLYGEHGPVANDEQWRMEV